MKKTKTHKYTKTSACQFCGKDFTHSTKLARFCSDNCRVKSNQRKKNLLRTEVLNQYDYTCLSCGATGEVLSVMFAKGASQTVEQAIPLCLKCKRLLVMVTTDQTKAREAHRRLVEKEVGQTVEETIYRLKAAQTSERDLLA
jgi:hypothetical protein